MKSMLRETENLWKLPLICCLWRFLYIFHNLFNISIFVLNAIKYYFFLYFYYFLNTEETLLFYCITNSIKRKERDLWQILCYKAWLYYCFSSQLYCTIWSHFSFSHTHTRNDHNESRWSQTKQKKIICYRPFILSSLII